MNIPVHAAANEPPMSGFLHPKKRDLHDASDTSFTTCMYGSLTSFNGSQSFSSHWNGDGWTVTDATDYSPKRTAAARTRIRTMAPEDSWNESFPVTTTAAAAHHSHSTMPSWTDFGASLAGPEFMIQEDEEDSLADDESIAKDDVSVAEENEDEEPVARNKEYQDLHSSVVSLDLSDLGLDATAHRGNVSVRPMPPRSTASSATLSVLSLSQASLNDPMYAVPTSLLSRKLRRDSLSSLPREASSAATGSSIETDDSSIPPSSLMMSQRLRKDSLSSLDHPETDEEEDEVPPSFLTRRLLQDSLMLDRYNCSASVWTEDESIPPAAPPPVSSSSALSQRLHQDAASARRRQAGGISIETEDSIPLSSLARRPRPAARHQPPPQQRHNAGNSVDTEGSSVQGMPLSRRFLQDSLTLPRYNATGGGTVETEESVPAMVSPLARRLMQDSLTFCYEGNSNAIEEDGGDQDDYTVDLIHMLRHQIANLQEKLHHEKLVTAQHNAQPPESRGHAKENGSKSLHEFLQGSGPGSNVVPKSNAVRAGSAVVSPSSPQNTVSVAEAGIQRSIAHLTASLERLQQQKEHGDDGTVLTDSFLVRVIAEQVELAKTLITAQKKEAQQDNHQLQAALDANTKKIAQIERRLKKRKKRSPCL
jgi:hypothetical protein